MLHIKCAHCGATLKGKDVIVATIPNFDGGVTYKDYAVTCPKCCGAIVWDRYVQKAAENKAKAVARLLKKLKKNMRQVSDEERYDEIMLRVAATAKKKAEENKENPKVRLKDLEAAVDDLPQETKDIMLAYEDKMDMAMLKIESGKHDEYVENSSILLLTQAIITLAIEDKDEDFFKSQYGEYIVDTYNNALTLHKHHDYNITACLLLEKMRQGKIKVRGESNDE